MLRAKIKKQNSMVSSVKNFCLKIIGAAADHKLITIAVVLAVAATSGLLAWVISRPPKLPDPSTQSPQLLAQIMVSNKFASQSDATKQKYFEAFRDSRDSQDGNRNSGLSNEQRRQLWQNLRPMMEQEMDNRMKEYFQLPPAQRTAYLDKFIDETQARWNNRQNRLRESTSRPAPTSQPNQRRAPTAQRMKNRIENTPPERRALRDQFRKDLQKRMQERGITPRGRR